MIIIKKNKLIKIDKKPLNLVEFREENRFMGEEIDYYVFAFLDQILIIAAWPHFYLAVLVGQLRN